MDARLAAARDARRAPTDRGSAAGIALSVGIPIWVGSRAWDFAPGLSLSDGRAWPFVVGLVLFWSGVALRWWAIRTLGRFFQLTVVIFDGHRVVEDGPYRRLRHPGYLGFLLGDDYRAYARRTSRLVPGVW